MLDRDPLPEVPGESIDLVLEVTTTGKEGKQFFEYRLTSPSGAAKDLSEKPHLSKPLGSPRAVYEDLLDELGKLRAGFDVEQVPALSDEIEAVLREIGDWLYQTLFPESLRGAFRTFVHDVEAFLVVTDEAWIPWELVRPSEDEEGDFLCMKFEMSRWLPGAGDPVAEKGVRRVLHTLIDDWEGSADLPMAGAEWQALQTLAEDVPGATLLPLEKPSPKRLKKLMMDGADLVHFAGHGQHRSSSADTDEDAYRPELAKIYLSGGVFRARQLSGVLAARLRRDRPLVFFNSCESGRLGQALAGLGGWAQGWIEHCGASAFLGPFLPVRDKAAGLFASAVYQELRAGKTLAAAVRTARHEVRRARPGDPLSPLAYILHAHPKLRIHLGGSVLQAVPIGARSSPLHLPNQRWNPDRHSPGALLRAEFGVVPFHFRIDAMENLEAWCLADPLLGIRLYTGPGGMGKTRLALEVCRRLRARGWQAGFVPHHRSAAETWATLEEIGGARLLVIDYSETRRPLIVALLKQILQSNGSAPVRILLLARAALDWWDQLRAAGEGVGELLSGPATHWHELRPLAFSLADRRESYRIAAEAFADRLDRPTSVPLPDDLAAKHFKIALLLHINALAAIEGVEVRGENGILDYVLHRERRFWKERGEVWELPPEVARGIGRAMATITLAGGVESEHQAVLAMRGLRFFQDEKESLLISVARILRETYPGEHYWIEPVLPDLLGEHLIQRELEVDSVEMMDLILAGYREEEDPEATAVAEPEEGVAAHGPELPL